MLYEVITPINGVYKNILGQLNYQPIRYLGGLGSTEVGTRQLSVSGGAVLLGNEYNGISPLNTSTGGNIHTNVCHKWNMD